MRLIADEPVKPHEDLRYLVFEALRPAFEHRRRSAVRPAPLLWPMHCCLCGGALDMCGDPAHDETSIYGCASCGAVGPYLPHRGASIAGLFLSCAAEA